LDGEVEDIINLFPMTDQTDNTATGNVTVASETKAAPAATTAAPGSELDALLKEFEQGVSKPANLPANSLLKVLSAFRDEVTPIREYVAAEAQTKADAQYQEDVKGAVAFVKKESGVPNAFSEKFVRGYLRDLVASDPSANEAWENRQKTPDTWKGYLSKASEAVKTDYAEFLKTIPVQKERVTSDVERAAATLRNVSTEPPQQPNLPSSFDVIHTMNDRDFKAYLQKVYAAQQAAQK